MYAVISVSVFVAVVSRDGATIFINLEISLLYAFPPTLAVQGREPKRADSAYTICFVSYAKSLYISVAINLSNIHWELPVIVVLASFKQKE